MPRIDSSRRKLKLRTAEGRRKNRRKWTALVLMMITQIIVLAMSFFGWIHIFMAFSVVVGLFLGTAFYVLKSDS